MSESLRPGLERRLKAELTGDVVATLQSGQPVHQFHVRLLKADGDAIPYAWPVVHRRRLRLDRIDALLGRYSFDATTAGKLNLVTSTATDTSASGVVEIAATH